MGNWFTKKASPTTTVAAATGPINGNINSTITRIEHLELHAQTHAALTEMQSTIETVLMVVFCCAAGFVCYQIYKKWTANQDIKIKAKAAEMVKIEMQQFIRNEVRSTMRSTKG